MAVAAAPARDESDEQHGLGRLGLVALGIVFGDIGTSPLYAFRQSLLAVGSGAPGPAEVLGLLSLIFWALILVISVKYLLLVLRADNDGEGGILALLALLDPWPRRGKAGRPLLVVVGLFGAALLYADGMITPAISVLSAVEGVSVVTSALEPLVLPLTIAVLVLLFALQRHGTAAIGTVFGVVMVLWFAALGLLGILGILKEPVVLRALSPLWALEFLARFPFGGFLALGAVFLAVTGGEALYADMGHLRRGPIRLAWFALVLPSLMLNYLGQGAHVLATDGGIGHPFFDLVPRLFLIPVVILATVATIIASQAVVSGAFSLTRQAIQLRQLPPMTIVQTSSKALGQIYMPLVNWLLMAAAVLLVLTFRSSSALAAAYGIAISTTMLITTVLLFCVMRERWRWSPWLAGGVAAGFGLIDCVFVAANLLKIPDGGWVPLVVAGAVFMAMSIWRYGARSLGIASSHETVPLEAFLEDIRKSQLIRLPGTAVYLTRRDQEAPPMLKRLVDELHAVHERGILLTVVTENVPRVRSADRIEILNLPDGFWRITLHYGFMQVPNIPVALRLCDYHGLSLDPDKAVFFQGYEAFSYPDYAPALRYWRERLFSVMARNAVRATATYSIPPDRLITIGLPVAVRRGVSGKH